MSIQQLARQREQPARLGAEHGYRIEGDTVCINADLGLPAFFSTRAFALELWACTEPHQGGALSGTKVCQVTLDLPTPLSPYVHHVEARADAHLPPHGRCHAMVLALVEQAPDGLRIVHDFFNYPELQAFDLPHFEGGVGYILNGSEVSLKADGIRNPRNMDNMSGTLSLELWASPAAREEMTRESVCLAAAELPRVSGQHVLSTVEMHTAFADPPAGRWNLSLLLREWTLAEGYVTRDRRTFAREYARSEPHDAASVLEPVSSPPAVTSARASAPAASGWRRCPVSIHTASVEQLAKVKGLNLRLAKEIVKARPFESLDELIKVRGIGAKTLERIKVLLTL
jgi:hypothetical protein